MLSNECPFLRTVLFDQFDQKDVLFFGPGFLLPCFTKVTTFYGVRIVRIDLFPSGHAVNILTSNEIAGNFLPIRVLWALRNQ